MSEDAAKFVGLDGRDPLREMHTFQMDAYVSDGQGGFRLRSEASEPLCETSVRASTASAAQAIYDIESPGRFSGYEDLGKMMPGTLSQMPTDQLVIRKAQDGGFVVIDSGAGIKGVPFLFAAGTIQEIAEYIENRFDPAS